MDKMVILITGVSSGFGKAIAERLAKDGHRVYGTVRREVPPIEGVTYLYADVLDDEAVKRAFDELMQREGRIDVFVNNAGMGIAGPLEFCTVADIQYQTDVNYMGMVRWLSHVIPVMRRQKDGKILCISSIAGRVGLPYQGAYSASKYAVTGYCEALRLELRRSGVKVVLIEPGDFNTGFAENRNLADADEMNRAYPSYLRSLHDVETNEAEGLEPSYLADKLAKIIRKKNPAGSYVVANWEQAFSIYLKRWLPEKWFDRILAHYYHM